ncbi:hypothetical protein SNEBB_009404 [Seison nebaliae]|nr:hypothetical protein SNEBB_009404 [Seison nebaliae]
MTDNWMYDFDNFNLDRNDDVGMKKKNNLDNLYNIPSTEITKTKLQDTGYSSDNISSKQNDQTLNDVRETNFNGKDGTISSSSVSSTDSSSSPDSSDTEGEDSASSEPVIRTNRTKSKNSKRTTTENSRKKLPMSKKRLEMFRYGHKLKDRPVMEKMKKNQTVPLKNLLSKLTVKEKQLETVEVDKKKLEKLNRHLLKEIDRIESQSGKFSMLTREHADYVTYTKQKMSEMKKNERRIHHVLEESEKETRKYKNEAMKYRKICEKHDLLERNDLQMKVEMFETDNKRTEEKFNRIETNYRLEKKNLQRELFDMRKKARMYRKESEEKSELIEQLRKKIEKSNKQFQNMNIYSRNMTIPNKSTVPNEKNNSIRKRSASNNIFLTATENKDSPKNDSRKSSILSSRSDSSSLYSSSSSSSYSSNFDRPINTDIPKTDEVPTEQLSTILEENNRKEEIVKKQENLMTFAEENGIIRPKSSNRERISISSKNNSIYNYSTKNDEDDNQLKKNKTEFIDKTESNDNAIVLDDIFQKIEKTSRNNNSNVINNLEMTRKKRDSFEDIYAMLDNNKNTSYQPTANSRTTTNNFNYG